MTFYAGIDAGSRTIKIVLLRAGEVIARGIADQGIAQEAEIERLYARVLQEAEVERDAVRAVATGYARNLARGAEKTVTEITCHARGVARLAPEARTVVEIGGQDSKLLWLEPGGLARDFAMNDRCAAGSGRFLETVAARLSVPLPELGALAARSTAPATINSTCVVFAETEIIGLLAAGTSPQDIAAGIQGSLARRVAVLAGGQIVPPVYFTGGVALVPGMGAALEEAFGCSVNIPPDPQYTGALGAALLAEETGRITHGYNACRSS